ncbi:methyltransferase type 11 [Candidatus Rickettsiella isopodorum]|jgi:2-polyprenyl-3-methyl-5-hydroxy-6-metoxy-1,4-benzoquinol methylase|uniref:Methyltransferase type 11 n=1 Tax=Candidatus Rickettsiella isopodorum TaxID=1225476 RepID=A0A1J8NJI6_9COXI|nr:class I SAM-dependent methyltransferase [Candidatus Rickettsiella isopodorum]OIZ94222.1 methyltransferase type 11 [Candidatus Rickettsiella isopodorum]
MKFKIAGGLSENGVVAGNVFNKYDAKNYIIRRLMQGFASSLSLLVNKVNPSSIYEIGCGEGYWVLHWNKLGLAARGCDVSSQVIKIAQANACDSHLPNQLFTVKDLYECDENNAADLIVCCEVLEHLADPNKGLRVLQKIVKKYLILSVPREPIWRLLNMLRGKYCSAFGNTPGHLQHWSKRRFVTQISTYFDILEVKTPFPWTMLLCQRK